MLHFNVLDDPGPASSIENEFTPIVATLAQLNNNPYLYQSRLVKVQEVAINWFGWLLEDMDFGLYTYTPEFGSFRLKTIFHNTDYISAYVSPSYSYNITGIITADTNGGSITPRFLSEIENDLDPVLYYPYNVTAESIEDDILVSWDPASWQFSHAGYDGCTRQYDTDGMTEFSVAHRYTPAQLKSYGVAGGKLYKITFAGIWSITDYIVNIYIGGSANPFSPGTLVHTQCIEELSYSNGGARLPEIELSAYIDIPIDQELWIEIQVTIDDEGYLSGDDHSGYLDGYGNLLFLNAEWTTAMQETPRFINNWMIMPRALLPDYIIVENYNRNIIKDTLLPIRTEYCKNELNSTSIIANYTKQNGIIVPNTNLLGYKIWRRDRSQWPSESILITPTPITNTYYTDRNIEPGVYSYNIVAVYDVGDSYEGYGELGHNNLVINTYPWIFSFQQYYDSWTSPYSTYSIGWTALDLDKDGVSWSNTFGTNGIASLDFGWGSHRTPDNWLISPKFVLPDDQPIDFKFFIASGERLRFKEEHYSILVSTTDKDINNFSEIFNETIFTGQPIERTIDLADYQGQSVYIAFRHHDSPYTLSLYEINIIISNFRIGTTYVSNEDKSIKHFKTELHDNFPNPFNPETIIYFSLQNTSNVTLEIYNIKGQKIKTLVNRMFDKGKHQIIWNGVDEHGHNVSSGVYFYRMKTDEYTAVKKMMLVK